MQTVDLFVAKYIWENVVSEILEPFYTGCLTGFLKVIFFCATDFGFIFSPSLCCISCNEVFPIYKSKLQIFIQNIGIKHSKNSHDHFVSGKCG